MSLFINMYGKVSWEFRDCRVSGGGPWKVRRWQRGDAFTGEKRGGGDPPGGLAYVGECLIDWRSSHDN